MFSGSKKMTGRHIALIAACICLTGCDLSQSEAVTKIENNFWVADAKATENLSTLKACGSKNGWWTLDDKHEPATPPKVSGKAADQKSEREEVHYVSFDLSPAGKKICICLPSETCINIGLQCHCR